PAEPLLLHAPPHQGLQSLVDDVGLARALPPRAAQHECELVDARIVDAELHIGASGLPYQLDRIAALRRFDQLPQSLGELVEALLDQAVEERLLVLEVQVEVGV